MAKYYDEAAYELAYAALVPDSGKAETLEGELLRAASRIAHDYTNNGFGNNWSGALKFLSMHGDAPESLLIILRPFMRGKMVSDRRATYDEDDVILFATERLIARCVDRAVEAINTASLHPNPCDMFDFQDKASNR